MEQKLFILPEDKFLNMDNLGKIRYWEVGNRSKPAIVFLHGIGSAVESWLAQIEFLSKYFYLTAIDIPGFGKSYLYNNNYNLVSILSVMDLFVQKKEIENLAIIGHSLGGFLALEFTNAHPSRIDKLVLIASGGFGMPSKRFRFLGSHISQLLFLPFVKTDFLGPKIFRYFYGNGLPVLAYQELSKHWENSTVVDSFVRVLRESDKHKFANVSCIICPTLIIWGSKDWVLNYRNSFVAKTKLPNSEVRILDGFSHGAHTETPEEINPIILGFLTSS